MIIKYNPAERVTLPKHKRVRESKTLQPEQLKAVLTALEAEPLPFRALITLSSLRDAGEGRRWR